MRIKSRDSNILVTYVIPSGDIYPGMSTVYMKPYYLRRFVSDVRYHRVLIVKSNQMEGPMIPVSAEVEEIVETERLPVTGHWRIGVRSKEMTWKVYFLNGPVGLGTRRQVELTQ